MGLLSIIRIQRLPWAIQVLGCSALAAIGLFSARLYQVRMMYRRVQKEHDIPMLPHSFLFGHLLIAAKINIKYKHPQDAQIHWMFHFIQQEYPEITKCGILYFDTWPVGYPMIAVFNPDMMAQFTQDNNQPKFWAQGQVEFRHYTGGEDLVHLEGQEWKQARTMFNPGFSARNLLSMVPQFIEEAIVFKKRFRMAAESKQPIHLEEYTTDFTLDVIGRAVLGQRLHSQSRACELQKSIQRQISFIYFNLDLFKQLHPLRHLTHWFANHQTRKILLPYIQSTVQNYERIEGPKTVLKLALKTFVAEYQDASSKGSIPPSFLERTINHIKIFLFAGHDTTAVALAHCYWLLAQNPDKAAKMLQEHDEVFGAEDPAAAVEAVSEDPALLNRLVYTGAVLKETLRLFPPVGGSVRQTPENFFLVDPESGVRYPTHGFMLHSSAATVGRDPKYWPEANSFVPERWLVRDEADPYYPKKNAWRPFEMGPRNCIGQELVNLEVKLILALTAREFDVESAYAANAPRFMDDTAYQVSVPDHPATAHIKDALPVIVKRRVRAD